MEPDALTRLVFEAAEYGVGISVKPYRGDNWVIGLIHGMGGEDVAKTRTLETAIDAASLALEEWIAAHSATVEVDDA